MREHLATLLDDFRRFDQQIAVMRYKGNRRRVTTYGEVARLAGRFAALLESRGIELGDRVLLWAENSAEWIAAFYGCVLRGVIVVPLDAFGSVVFAERVAVDVKPKLVVGDGALVRKLNPMFQNRDLGHPGSLLEKVPALAFEEWDDSLPAGEAGAIAGLGRETPLQILFTSGTTGDPKGIVHTHGNVLASVEPIEQAIKGYLRYERVFHPLRFLHTLPLSHVFGQTMGLWIPPMLAAQVHFESRLVARQLIETIKRERISVLAAVPRVMALLKTHLETSRPGLTERVTAAKDLNAWRRWWVFRDVHRAFGLKFWVLISGGGALTGTLEQFWNALGFVVVQGYGMTETTALITLNHPFHVVRGTIGKPLPGREVKLGPDGEVLVRGPMISGATWSGGGLKQRASEWLATGDLAEMQETGELRFTGRKSETIVTAAGMNVHPEDLEAALEEQPEIAACTVVALETSNGPEAFAVLSVRGAESHAAEAVERANARLAEFQRVRRWMIWPDPDLPRTPTGKVKRALVADWVRTTNSAESGKAAQAHDGARDWLLELVAVIAGERPAETGDEARLSDDFHLDSLGRVQLAAALEEKLADSPAEASVDLARTLGDLRVLVNGNQRAVLADLLDRPVKGAGGDASHFEDDAATGERVQAKSVEGERYVYPRWPWWGVVQWVREAFVEIVAQPLVWGLAKPRVVGQRMVNWGEPILIVCNHVTTYDGALVQYALAGRMRRRMAAMMSGEMLDDFRHFRNPERRPGERGFLLFGPVAYLLLTALYNVFPLPRKRDFQRSFAHAGEALDRGYNVLVFPEGTRSAEGVLARFRPGIGMLVKQSQTAVLPMAILGLGDLKTRRRGWFRSGTIEVRVGKPLRFGGEESEGAIAARLQTEVQELMGEAGIS